MYLLKLMTGDIVSYHDLRKVTKGITYLTQRKGNLSTSVPETDVYHNGHLKSLSEHSRQRSPGKLIINGLDTATGKEGFFSRYSVIVGSRNTFCKGWGVSPMFPYNAKAAFP